MQTFNDFLEAKNTFSDQDFAGETGPYKTFRIRYAYKKGNSYYQAWGYGSGKDEQDASEEFVEFLKSENGYPEVKVLEVKRVPATSASSPQGNVPAGLTNRTPTNQKIDVSKFGKM